MEFATAEGEDLPGQDSLIAAELMLMTVTGNIPAVLIARLVTF
jgi:hypothetical protein